MSQIPVETSKPSLGLRPRCTRAPGPSSVVPSTTSARAAPATLPSVGVAIAVLQQAVGVEVPARAPPRAACSFSMVVPVRASNTSSGLRRRTCRKSVGVQKRAVPQRDVLLAGGHEHPCERCRSAATSDRAPPGARASPRDARLERSAAPIDEPDASIGLSWRGAVPRRRRWAGWDRRPCGPGPGRAPARWAGRRGRRPAGRGRPGSSPRGPRSCRAVVCARR